jgi:hypothetical protein
MRVVARFAVNLSLSCILPDTFGLECTLYESSSQVGNKHAGGKRIHPSGKHNFQLEIDGAAVI